METGEAGISPPPTVLAFVPSTVCVHDLPLGWDLSLALNVCMLRAAIDLSESPTR